MASFQTMQDGSRIDSAQMLVVPNTTHTDITSLNFFNQASLIYSNNNGTFYSAAPPRNITLQDLNENVVGNYPYALSHISINVDVFAKSFYSTILTDLGQTGKSNAFSGHSESPIRYLLSAISEVSTAVGGSANSTFVYPNNDVLQINAYDTLKDEIPLRVEPATIYAQYACSIPKLKDTPSLIVSIIIRDLVLLQVAWEVLKWVASKRLESRDQRADWCEGCVPNSNANGVCIGSVVPADEKEEQERAGVTSWTPPRSPMSTDLLLPLTPSSPRTQAEEKEEQEHEARRRSVHKARTC